MYVKGHHSGLHTTLQRLGARSGEQQLVRPVYPIELADSHHAGATPADPGVPAGSEAGSRVP